MEYVIDIGKNKLSALAPQYCYDTVEHLRAACAQQNAISVLNVNWSTLLPTLLIASLVTIVLNGLARRGYIADKWLPYVNQGYLTLVFSMSLAYYVFYLWGGGFG